MFSLNSIGGSGNAPIIVIAVLALLIGAAYPVIKMIGWWADGTAEPLFVMTAVAMYLILIGMAMSAPAALAVLIFAVIFFSSIATAIWGNVGDSVGLARIDTEQLTAYSAALERNPMDSPARLALAEMLYKQGRADEAIAHAQWTLDNSPGLSMRIKPMLDTWKRQRERETTNTPEPLFCHMCYAENAPYSIECTQCGAKFGTRAGMRDSMDKEGGPKKVLMGWLAASVAVMVAFLALMIMPIVYAAPIILSTTIVCAFLFLRWVSNC